MCQVYAVRGSFGRLNTRRLLVSTPAKTNTKVLVAEYALNGLFSVQSDVFSFGVVVLKIISGKRNTAYYQNQQAFSLISYSIKNISSQNLKDIM
ncbi:Protein kinase-like domain-containing protein, partial [Cynara cardunculus var. scolymus]